MVIGGIASRFHELRNQPPKTSGIGRLDMIVALRIILEVGKDGTLPSDKQLVLVMPRLEKWVENVTPSCYV
jgi:hypothetical protein